MVSRRSRVHERRLARKAFLLLIASLGLFLFLLFFGIPSLIRFAIFINELKGSSVPLIQEDKTPPAPPRLDSLPSYKNEGEIKVAGTAESAATLKVFRSGELEKETLVGEEGTFSLTLRLSVGENRVWATATDPAGNESEPSEVQVVVYDKEPPTLELTKPEAGKELYGLQKNVTVEGTTESDARVSVNERLAIVDGEGNFSLQVPLEEGENILTVKAVDQAGNETERTTTVYYSP